MYFEIMLIVNVIILIYGVYCLGWDNCKQHYRFMERATKPLRKLTEPITTDRELCTHCDGEGKMWHVPHFPNGYACGHCGGTGLKPLTDEYRDAITPEAYCYKDLPCTVCGGTDLEPELCEGMIFPDSDPVHIAKSDYGICQKCRKLIYIDEKTGEYEKHYKLTDESGDVIKMPGRREK